MGKERIKFEKNIPKSILNPHRGKIANIAKDSKLGVAALNFNTKSGNPQSGKKVTFGGKLAVLKKNVAENKPGYTIEQKSIQTKFITKFMRKGKKEKAEITLFKALKKVEQSLISVGVLKGLLHSKSSNSKSGIGFAALKEKLNLHSGNKTVANGIVGNKIDTAVLKKESVPHSGLQHSGFSQTPKVGSQLNLGQILEKIINNAKPLIRLKKVRIAGATHQKPIALTKKQAETDAIKRIIINAKMRSEKSSTLKLAKEFEEIYLNVLSNKTLTEVRELHKLAEANKANITLK